MPYIRESRRVQLDNVELGDGGFDCLTPGELTYVLYRIMVNALPSSPSYNDIHKVLGAVEAAKLEFYRRKVAPYEDKKIEVNGDV